MDPSTQAEGVNINDLAAQMLGLNDGHGYVEPQQQNAGHPAWQEILSAIPEELHSAVIPTLQKWDAGVSRSFQKIHDDYAPYKQFEDYDPSDISEALGVYRSLVTDPASTWEAIGRVYELSPQQSQAMSEQDNDYLDNLPDSVKEKLSKIDMHDQVLEYVSQQMLDRQASDEEAQEDAALDEILYDLREAYGDYDEDYVVGLIASGVDPEDAVGRFQQFTSQYAPQKQQQSYEYSNSAPRVMSSGGGIPNTGSVDVNKLSNQDTQDLIASILRISQENSS
jgi:hypothetical protein